MRRWKFVAVLLLVGCVVAAAVVWWRLPHGPNVLLITLDTTRADRLGCYGYQLARTPFLDRLAREGVQFDNAITHVPLTLPAHATLMTGLLPPEHGLHMNAMGSLPTQGIPTLAEHFSTRGYRTGAFVSAFVLDKRFGLARGFDSYDDDLSSDEPVEEKNLARRRKADRVVDSALAWLCQPRRRDPYFCWIHLYDPHSPRSEHSEKFGKEFAGRDYDAELAFVDGQLERLTSNLRAQGLLENTIVIVAGDHGESLGEHNELWHGKQLYQSTQRIPLLVHSPQRFAGGGRVATAVGLNDLLPTIADCLDWNNVEIPTKAAGRSLRRALEGQNLAEVPYYSEAWEPFFTMHCAPQFGIVSEGWKYIRSPQPELYQLSRDPQEQTNLAATQPQRCKELDVMLSEIESRFVIRKSEKTRIDSNLDASLKSIGYSGGNSTLPSTKIAGRLPDAKELMRASMLRTEAQVLSARDRPGAIAMLERVVGQWPQLHAARLELATLMLTAAFGKGVDEEKRKQLLVQVEELCRGLILDEQNWPADEQISEAHAVLAAVLAETNRFDEADKAYEQATKMEPTNATVFLEWGRMFLRRNEIKKGLEKLNIAIGIDEGLFTAQLQVGEILLDRTARLSASGRPEDREEVQRLQTEAIRHFELATRYNPSLLPAHYHAARLLMDRQQFAAAAAHYQKIAALDSQQGVKIKYLWALALANQKKYQDATKLLHEVLASDPQHAEARKLLSVCED